VLSLNNPHVGGVEGGDSRVHVLNHPACGAAPWIPRLAPTSVRHTFPLHPLLIPLR
jgi:hypothetical protein